MLLRPDHSNSRVLKEFNPYHEPGGTPKGGEFASAHGSSGAIGDAPAYVRPPTQHVSNIDEAVRLVLQGKNVELDDPRAVNTLVQKLAAMAMDAKTKGEQAPVYDLCQVSVAGTNLFCGASLGVPRLQMPQFAGTPEPGSAADLLPRDERGEVNGAKEFISYLKTLKINVAAETISAATLKASQSELIGSKVAAMMVARGFDPGNEPLFVSRDNYVVDGHHRWAAVVGRDAEDNHLGDTMLRTLKIDAPISEVLHVANAWTKLFGIQSVAGGAGGRMLRK